MKNGNGWTSRGEIHRGWRRLLETLEAAGHLGVLHIRQATKRGIAVFQVLERQIRPFDFSDGSTLTTSLIAPADAAGTGNKAAIYLAGTYQGNAIEDLLYHDDVDTLIHAKIDVYPKDIGINPLWVTGFQQSDYHDILTATKDSPFGYLEPPIDVIAIPEVRLQFGLRNFDKTLSILPNIRYIDAIYNVKYVVDVDTVEAVLRRKLRLPWFSIYGYKGFPYSFSDKMKITEPIPVDADREKIKKILDAWKALGQWTI